MDIAVFINPLMDIGLCRTAQCRKRQRKTCPFSLARADFLKRERRGGVE